MAVGGNGSNQNNLAVGKKQTDVLAGAANAVTAGCSASAEAQRSTQRCLFNDSTTTSEAMRIRASCLSCCPTSRPLQGLLYRTQLLVLYIAHQAEYAALFT
jgi:hypothetical protein